MSNALGSHGTLVAYQATPGSVTWTTIGELGDIAPPETSLNEFETTPQQENIDSYVFGYLRRSPLTFPVNFIPTNGTHDHLTGLYYHQFNKIKTGYKLTWPDGSTWVASGTPQSIKPNAPVEGKLSADITIRFSGTMMINGAAVGG